MSLIFSFIFSTISHFLFSYLKKCPSVIDHTAQPPAKIDSQLKHGCGAEWVVLSSYADISHNSREPYVCKKEQFSIEVQNTSKEWQIVKRVFPELVREGRMCIRVVRTNSQTISAHLQEIPPEGTAFLFVGHLVSSLEEALDGETTGCALWPVMARWPLHRRPLHRIEPRWPVG